MAFRKGVALEQQQFLEPLQEIVVAAGVLPPPQRVGGDGVGAGGPAQPEIDASGKQRLEHLEALGNHQRCVIGQHDAAGAHADARGRRRDLPDHDVGRGTRDRRQVVVLGDPIAGEAQAVGEPRQVERIAQRNGAGRPCGDRRQIEDGEGNGPYRHARVRTATAGAGANPFSIR